MAEAEFEGKTLEKKAVGNYPHEHEAKLNLENVENAGFTGEIVKQEWYDPPSDTRTEWVIIVEGVPTSWDNTDFWEYVAEQPGYEPV